MTFQRGVRRRVATPAQEEQQMRRVTVQHVGGCPDWRVLDRRLRDLSSECDIATDHRRVETAEEAERIRFRGSPTLLSDDVDPFAAGDRPVGPTCRVYLTDDGPQGSPTTDREAHRRRATARGPHLSVHSGPTCCDPRHGTAGTSARRRPRRPYAVVPRGL